MKKLSPKEAFDALCNGKKITRECFGPDAYVWWNGDYVIDEERHVCEVPVADLLTCSWMLYEEPWLQVGDKIYSTSSGETFYVKCADDNYALAASDDGHILTFRKDAGIADVFRITRAAVSK